MTMGLEEFLYGSKTVRDFLKLFSEQQWNRLCKATIMLGIQYLTNITGNDLRSLSLKDIEDVVGMKSILISRLENPKPFNKTHNSFPFSIKQ